MRRRGWVDRQHFLDASAATNIIPGPYSTEMAIHLGYLPAGRLGRLVSGLLFILPALAMLAGVTWAYQHLRRFKVDSLWLIAGGAIIDILQECQAPLPAQALARASFMAPTLAAGPPWGVRLTRKFLRVSPCVQQRGSLRPMPTAKQLSGHAFRPCCYTARTKYSTTRLTATSLLPYFNLPRADFLALFLHEGWRGARGVRDSKSIPL